ncbi:MAG: GyrI-like domain-containing protein, partial [Mycobacterium sp.]|nr:GyrI-like domain-containing protein [Mycobacterium sp.]
PVLAIREPVIGDDVNRWREAAFTHLHTALGRLGVAAAGPDGALYPTELLETGEGEVTAFVPTNILARTEPGGRVQALLLPATEFAVATHTGALDDLDHTFTALATVVAERAIGVDGPIQENYPDPAVIDIFWPVFHTTAAGADGS